MNHDKLGFYIAANNEFRFEQTFPYILHQFKNMRHKQHILCNGKQVSNLLRKHLREYFLKSEDFVQKFNFNGVQILTILTNSLSLNKLCLCCKPNSDELCTKIVYFCYSKLNEYIRTNNLLS